MPRYALTHLALTLLLIAATSSAADWAQWRGPTGDNHAPPGTEVPTTWGATQNIVWKTPLPGRGHASPTVVGDQIYLATAEEAEQLQSLLILDRQSGTLLRKVRVHRGNFPDSIHHNNTHASSTVASDGQQVYTLFYNDGATWVTAFDLQGEQLWQQRVATFDPQKYQFGFGSSPRLVEGKIVIASEYDGPGCGLYALSPASGEQLWEAKRPEGISFSSPAVATLEGETQLLISGRYLVASYATDTGQENWSVEGTASCTCGTMTWDDQLGLVFASGGYPETFTLAVRLDDEPQIVWKNNTKCYEQSLLVAEGYVYGFADSGVLYCWRATDGQTMWKKRLVGPVSSSPLLVGDQIFATNEKGTTYVIRTNPEEFELLAENQLGTDCFPTPSPVGNRLYHRYGDSTSGVRQEYLVAIGE